MSVKITEDPRTYPHQGIILLAPRHAGVLEFVTPGIAALPGFDEFIAQLDGQYQVIPPEPVRDKETLMASISIMFELYVERCRQLGVELPEHEG